jgi:zinc transport system substrate-binding protein
VAAAYPFAWVASQVAGADAHVTDLVRAGTEPHDVELSPRQIGAVEQASLVVYLRGFQPAVDDAVRETPEHRRVDVRSVTEVQPLRGDLDEDRSEAIDPHVWLDPLRMADIAHLVGERLAEVDRDHAYEYRTRAGAIADRLTALHFAIVDDLQDCRRHELVTAHTAFAYLAERYGLTQVGVTGLDPENEPSPRRIAKVARYAREHGVTTIFFESRVDPKLAETVAEEIGARTAVLDPVEGVSGGDDYLSVMRRNAAALAQGLDCA